MIKRIKRAILQKFVGDNILFRNVIQREYRSGHKLKATALMLYLFPLRRLVSIGSPIRALSFTTNKKYYQELHELLHISKTEGLNLIRIGSENDGGYIMLDDFNDGGIAYSFGIGGNVSWDRDIASRGYDVFMYDHTIDGLPESNSRFHWFKQGISDGVTQNDRLKTLEQLIEQNGHQDKKNLILKMDVEGAEWGFLENVKPETLVQFSQMTFEFHNIPRHDRPEQVLAVFRKLNRTHKLVHAHVNNTSGYISFGGKVFSPLLELSYALRESYSFTDDYDVNLPIGIDSPNNAYIPEVELGRWNEPFEPGDMLTARTRVM